MDQIATSFIEVERSHDLEPSRTRTPRWVWGIAAYLPAFLATPAIALGAAGLSGKGPAALRERRWLSVAALAGGAALLAKWQLERFFLEQPDYIRVASLNGLEIREYEPRIVAETLVTDALDWDTARSEGFRRLASYIQGDNEQRVLPGAEWEIERGRSERLAMTTPVTMRASSSGYIVSFGMPKGRRLLDLPVPTDTNVALRTDRGGRIAVLRFRGPYDPELVANKEAELVLRAREADLEILGETRFAGYDAPSTLPFLRRVEVWVPIA